MTNVLDKNVSKPNLIFIVVATILIISLILITVAFAGLFRSDMYKLQQEELINSKEQVTNKN